MIYEIKYNKKINTIKNSCIALFCINHNKINIYLVQLKNNLWEATSNIKLDISL